MEVAATATIRSKTASPSSTSLNFLHFCRIFDFFDKNGSGMITVYELSQALGRFGLDAKFSELESTIENHIKLGNIRLRYENCLSLNQSLDDSYFDYGKEEFEVVAKACTEEVKMRQEESNLSEAFKVFDLDRDGYIYEQELQVVLMKLRLPEVTEIDRVQQMIISVDRNHDGCVDFFEFKHMMSNVVF